MSDVAFLVLRVVVGGLFVGHGGQKLFGWFGDRVEALRQTAETEFATVARAINQHAAEIGTAADYDDTWGPGR